MTLLNKRKYDSYCISNSPTLHYKFNSGSTANWDKCWQPSDLAVGHILLCVHCWPEKLPVNTLLCTAQVSYQDFLKVNISSGTLSLNCTLFRFNLTAPAAFLVKSTVHYWDPFYGGAVRCNLMNLWHKAPFHCRTKNRGYLDPVGLYVKDSP